jgi:hypothetical protein
MLPAAPAAHGLFQSANQDFLFALTVAADEFVDRHGYLESRLLPPVLGPPQDFAGHDDLARSAGLGQQFDELLRDRRRRGALFRHCGLRRERTQPVGKLLLQMLLHPLVGLGDIRAKVLGVLCNRRRAG